MLLLAVAWQRSPQATRGHSMLPRHSSMVAAQSTYRAEIVPESRAPLVHLQLGTAGARSPRSNPHNHLRAPGTEDRSHALPHT